MARFNVFSKKGDSPSNKGKGESGSVLQTTMEANPWFAARIIHDDRIGSAYMRAKNWRTMAFLSGAATLVSVVGLWHMGNQPKLVPYIVETDKLGQVNYVGKVANETTETPELKGRIIKSYLNRLITDVRSVTTDPIPQKAAVDRTFSMIAQGTAAQTKFMDHFKANDPFKRALTETVAVEVSNILPISDKTWQIEWSETVRNLQGMVMHRTRWKASLSIGFNPPQEEEQQRSNPLGLFVTDFNWAQQI